MYTHILSVKIMTILIIVVCIVNAASPSPAQTTTQKVITVWTHNLPGNVECDALITTVKEFEQAQGDYTIELVPIAHANYADRVTGSAQSGSLPCVLEFDGPYLYNFAWTGYLEPNEITC